MPNAISTIDRPANEAVMNYRPGSSERRALVSMLGELREMRLDIPLAIGGERVRTKETGACVIPHDHGHRLATYHRAGAAEVAQAIAVAGEAAGKWAAMDWEERLAIFNRAADLIAGPWRMRLNAATMLVRTGGLIVG